MELLGLELWKEEVTKNDMLEQHTEFSLFLLKLCGDFVCVADINTLEPGR